MAVTVPAWGAQTRQSPQRRSNRSRASSQRDGNRTGRSTGSVAKVGASLPRSSRAARELRMRENVARARVDAVRPRSKARYVLIAAVGFLLAGVVLFLPGLSAQASRGVPESPAQSVVTVRPGDSLWSVAKRTMPEVDTRSAVIELRKANALSGPNLVAGQKLVVPGR
jgi:hypothetical protein